MGEVTLVEGSTFCVSDANGDIEPGGTHGLYVLDTRLLMKWRLRLDGRAAEPLTSFNAAPYQATFLGRTRPYPGGTQPYLGRRRPLLVRRDRYVGSGLREDVTLVNTGAEATSVELTIELDCDFADLFEVRTNDAFADLTGGRANDVRTRGDRTVSVEPSAIEFEYSWRGRKRGCRIETDERATVLPGLLVFRSLVPPRGKWTATIAVSASIDGNPMETEFHQGQPPEIAKAATRHRAWQEDAPRIETRDARLRQTFERSRADLGSLRIHGDGGTAVAAGAPWYMTLFGRDSLLAAYLALPLSQGLALGTLNELARYQGAKTDEATEEEPGKIVHEVRAGIDPSLNLGGGHRYYGTVDATPLFVVLLGELNRWGTDVEALLPNADRALEWIERASRNGFLAYQRRTDRGLLNQGWKDSADGVNFADGRLARPPIAMAEVQGYVYAAYLARAELAGQDGATRRRYKERAAALRRRFDEVFWLPDRGWYATALDGDGRPVDALTSNIGHCLWSGIVPPSRAREVADHLLSKEMFTGWGVRTLASSMGAYDPVSYHNGSVWPHDNALVAAGLMRYGLVEHAQRVALGILDAAAAFDGRLPELFCGFNRADYPRPVPYPTSCSPQAWAAAAPVQLLRTLLRLDPDVPRGELRLAPALPAILGEVGLRGVPVAGARLDITAGEITGLPETITPVREPPRPD